MSDNQLINRIVSGYSGEYKILELIGRGGMSAVYKAQILGAENQNPLLPIQRTHLGQVVALKVLLDRLLDDREHYKRFQQEVTMAKRLSHPNIVEVFDAGEIDGRPFMVLEFIEGSTLSSICKENSLPIQRALPIFKQICSAFAYAHQRNIVHRDVKPSNIMLAKKGDKTDIVKVVDFGIAKIVNETAMGSTQLTKTGDVFGTPAYMSPEQCRGESLDQRSDIYSFGIVMYETLTGHPPFVSDKAYTVMMKQASEMPRGLGDIDPDVGLVAKVENIIFKCLNKDLNARYQNMDQIIDDLENAMHYRSQGFKFQALLSRKISSSFRNIFHGLNNTQPAQKPLIISSIFILVLASWLLWPVYGPGSCPSQNERTIAWQEPASSAYATDQKKFEQAEKALFDVEKSYRLLGKLGTEEGFNFQRQFGDFYFLAESWFKSSQRYYYAIQLIPKLNLEDTEKAADVLLAMADCQLRNRGYDNCVLYGKQALSNYKHLMGNAQPLVYTLNSMKALALIGLSYAKLGNSQEADSAMQEFGALMAQGNRYVVEPEVTAPYAYAIGNYYFERGQYAKAETMYKYALELPLKDKIHKANVAASLNQLGLVYEKLKRTNDAQKCFDQAYRTLLEAGNAYDPRIANILFNDADALWSSNKWWDSFQVQSHARDIWKRK